MRVGALSLTDGSVLLRAWSAHRRRQGPLLCALGVLLWVVYHLPVWQRLRVQERSKVATASNVTTDEDDPYHPSKYTVLGGPSIVFSTNLKPEYRYITGWLNSGWTNDVMTYANLLYLAHLTSRIAVLGPFVPSHLDISAGYLPFSEVFDIPHLARALHMPIMEWSDLKSAESEVAEEMGCWSTWMSYSGAAGNARSGWVPDTFALDVSYTPVPPEIYEHNAPNDPHITFASLLPLAFPEGRSSALTKVSPAPSEPWGTVMPPSDHLLCFDVLYFVQVGMSGAEWGEEYAPVWRLVGREMRWAGPLREKADQYLRSHWGVEEEEEIPPYISVHVRRNDFRDYCSGTLTCMPTLAQLQRRVSEVQSRLLAEQGLSVPNVLVTSDEQSPAWWSEVHALGYTSMNHTELNTEGKYGEWYPSVLDAVFLSLGKGFVGTEGSTMSLLARRRVEDWGGGVATWLRWMGVAQEEL
ncbi:hypothetical protein CALCODRAFT_518640 [Calocera cornea HHB12733]|uniref:Uncharacterized protein n=1 Tax=Calocera cornea HHB12733 TaxID=1353952 RepID=A0A165EW16_9BASI|nr:hypothetical protein CALCODRAFT_518640 [Calocera cornea HHB12733]